MFTFKQKLAAETTLVEFCHISTLTKAIDHLLGGHGLPLGKGIYEICGAPGCGKSQLCFQLAISATIPKIFGGVDGEALIFDTDGSCSRHRLEEILRATVTQLREIKRFNDDKMSEWMELQLQQFVSECRKRIHVVRLFSPADLNSVIIGLADILESLPNVKLVVVDSIATMARAAAHDFWDFSEDLREGLTNKNLPTEVVLKRMLQSSSSDHTQDRTQDRTQAIQCRWGRMLRAVSVEANVAVMVTNHMISKFPIEGNCVTTFALGPTWGHLVSCRLLITEETQEISENFYEDHRNAFGGPIEESGDGGVERGTAHGVRRIHILKGGGKNQCSDENKYSDECSDEDRIQMITSSVTFRISSDGIRDI